MGGENLEDNRKKVVLNVKFNFDDLSDVDKYFAKASVAIGYTGRNRNGTDITKESFESAVASLINKPIVGHFLPEEDDFGEHEFQTITNESGESEIVPVTVPFGLVPESAKQYWATITEDNGAEHEYFMTEALLWKRQYGYKVFQRKKCHQSMEIDVLDYQFDTEGYAVVTSFAYDALCVLGDNVEPCFESASIQLYSDNESQTFSTQCKQMLEEFKLYTQEVLENINGEEENRTMNEDNAQVKDPIDGVVSDDTAAAPIPAEGTENPADNKNESGVTPVGADEGSGEAEPTAQNEGAENTLFTRAFTLSHDDVRCKLYNAMGTEWRGYIVDVWDNYFVCEEYNDYGGKKRRCSYTKNADDTVTIGESVEVFAEYVTQEEKDALDFLRNDYPVIKEELMTLKQFKADTEAKQATAEKNALLDKWSAQFTPDSASFNTVKENVDSYSISELETALKVAYADTKATFSLATDEKKAHVGVYSRENNDNVGPYGGLMDKYNIKPMK